MFRQAIARKPGANVYRGLTSANLGRPNFELICAQHDAYVRALESCGVAIELLEADERYPDGCFVEDVAIVAPGCIVMTRPGAPSRRGEGDSIEPLLASHGDIEHIEAPGSVDGGDIVIAGDRVLVGLSQRTNRDGARQLERILGGHGMRVQLVPVTGSLHLKSDVNYLGDDRLIVTRAYVSRDELASFARIAVPDDEGYAANSLICGNSVLVPAGYPGTLDRLEQAGFTVVALGMSEFQKMDGGLTCLSLRL